MQPQSNGVPKDQTKLILIMLIILHRPCKFDWIVLVHNWDRCFMHFTQTYWEKSKLCICWHNQVY